jgi:hypothetical protein
MRIGSTMIGLVLLGAMAACAADAPDEGVATESLSASPPHSADDLAQPEDRPGIAATVDCSSPIGDWACIGNGAFAEFWPNGCAGLPNIRTAYYNCVGLCPNDLCVKESIYP